MDRFARTRLILGQEAMDKLKNSRVAVFGLGGVGGYVCEALARSGIGALDLIDNDTVSITNINRQIIATEKTVGRYKTEAAKERVLEINPDCFVTIHTTFFLPDTANKFDFASYDFVVDAIDNVTGKLCLAEKCQETGTPIISSMGTGNKLDPTALTVDDIYNTSVCPLARVMRRECRKRGIKRLKVVYSKEAPIPLKEACAPDDSGGRRSVPGSTAFVPPAAGLIIASEVIKTIIKNKEKR